MSSHHARFKPSPEETLALVEDLYKFGDHTAHVAMSPFIGTRAHDAALPVVRREANRLLRDPRALVPRPLRDHIKEFGAKYGFKITSANPRNRSLTLRLTGDEAEALTEAAAAAGLLFSDFVRQAALDRAQGRDLVGLRARANARLKDAG